MASAHEPLHSPLLPPSPAPLSRPAALLHACLAYHRAFFLLLGPLSFVVLIVCLDVEEDNTGKSGAMLAAMSWMFIWWVTEAIPLAVTALIPLFLLPFLQIQTASAVSKSYTNDTIFLILGAFILAAAVRYHELHKRLAIHIVLLFGSDPRLLLFGICMAAAFISMWVDNGPATAMLLPMAAGVQQKVHAGFHPHCYTDDDEQDDGNPDNMKQDILSRHSSAICEGDDGEHFGHTMIEEVSSDAASKDGPNIGAHVISMPAHDYDFGGLVKSNHSDAKGPSRTWSLPTFNSKELPSNISRRKSLPVYASKELERLASERLEKHLSNVLLRMDSKEALKIEMDFCKGISISIAVAVTIGGMSTLTGNPVNLIFTGIWETDFPKENPIYFLQWMLFAVPFSLVLVLVLWVLLCIWFCPPSAVKPVSASLHSYHMADELVRLGPITSDQIIILIIFSVLVVLWMTKSLTGDGAGWAAFFNDYPANGTVTILMAVSLFVIPNPRDPKHKLMDWSQCRDIPWAVILLVGGGFALADGIRSSGLSDVITRKMNFLHSTPYWAITPAIATVVGIVTEFTSNSATASVFVPIAAEIALSINRHPLFLMVPTTLASQFAYMLPIATGPNAMVYATESMRVKDMAAPGIVLKIIAIILLSILMPTLGTLVFNTNSTVQT